MDIKDEVLQCICDNVRIRPVTPNQINVFHQLGYYGLDNLCGIMLVLCLEDKFDIDLSSTDGYLGTMMIIDLINIVEVEHAAATASKNARVDQQSGILRGPESRAS